MPEKRLHKKPFSRRYGLLVLAGLWLLGLCACGGGPDGTDAGGYRVEGAISVASAMAFDSDTNDPDAAYESNDSQALAQILSVPVRVGGYVNRPGRGVSGRSRTSGDVRDFFAATLVANQTVALRFPSADEANLDLYLYNSDGLLYDSSVGTGRTETLTVTSAGTYYIEVRATSGASVYTLAVSLDSFSTGAEELHLGDDFVAGEVIVRFSDSGMSTAGLETLDSRAGDLGLQGYAGQPGRAMRMGFGNRPERDRAFDRLGIDREKMGARVFQQESGEVQDKWDTIEVVRTLRQRSDVAFAEPNYRRYSTAIPDDTSYSSQAWHYGLINLPSAWDTTTGNDNIIVAVVDTGVLLNHPDLDDRLVAGYDFVRDTSSSNDGNGIDSDPDDPGDSTTGNSSFHGTHVAGIIAAETDNSTGMAGVSWHGKIMPVRALGINGGTSYDVIQAVRFAAGLSNDSGTLPGQAADIINLSLGGSGYSQSEQNVYDAVRDQGIIVVAAAGNGGSSTSYYPAAYDGVVSVSAVDRDENLASYSSYGATIDVAAPGGDDSDYIYSTLGNDSSGSISYTYGGYQGTSMAAPHVSGVAALIKGLYSSLTPDDFDALLAAGTITGDIGGTGRDNLFGHGLIDAYKAVDWAANDQTVPSVLMVDAESLTFDTSTDSLSFEVSLNNGSASGVTAADDASWLSVAATSVGSSGLGTYTASVDRSGLANGTYSATMSFSGSGVTSAEVAVTMQVGSGDAVDGGYHHIYLLDPQTGEIVYEVAGVLQDGERRFSFTGVAEGTYELHAGTDADNDSIVGDEAESAGAYGSLYSPLYINVYTDCQGLDFEVDFSTISQD